MLFTMALRPIEDAGYAIVAAEATNLDYLPFEGSLSCFRSLRICSKKRVRYSMSSELSSILIFFQQVTLKLFDLHLK